MSEVINGNMNDVLDAIRQVQDKNVYPVYIPLLKKNVMFRELTTKQEKMLVKTIVDSPIFNSEFIFAIKQIIKENCAEELDIDSLTIIDKTAICLTMRMKSIGNEFEYVFKENDTRKIINISDYIEKFNNIEIPSDRIIENANIKIVCGFPTIKTEYEMERELRSNINNIQLQDINDARDTLGNVFTNEIVKYIKSITIINANTQMELDMTDYNFKNRIEILEEIGNLLINKVMDYIFECNTLMRDALLIEDEIEIPESHQKQKLIGRLEVGSDFFIS